MSSHYDLPDGETASTTPAASGPFSITFLLDPGGAITTWNPAIETLLLYGREQWTGQNEQTLRVSGGSDCRAEREQALRDGAAQGIHEYRRSDGTCLHAEATLTAHYDAAGTPVGYSRTLQSLQYPRDTEAAERESRFQLAADAA